jgi:hypothetical protein
VYGKVTYTNQSIFLVLYKQELFITEFVLTEFDCINSKDKMSLFMFILHLFLCLFLGSLEVIQDDEVVAILGEQRKAKKNIYQYM